MSVGALRRLRSLSENGCPLLLRTARHPCVEELTKEGLIFSRSFDSVYESEATFDNVYEEIVNQVLATARLHGAAAYLVPGHPLIGEKTVQLLLEQQPEFAIELYSGSSFIEASLLAVKRETGGLLVIDALSLPNPTDVFRSYPRPFLPDVTHLIYQVYDRQIAGMVKLSLLESFGPDHPVQIVARAGQGDAQRVQTVALFRLDHADCQFDHLTSVIVPPDASNSSTRDFNTLLDIMAQLRHPTTGCPWDREQTPETLKKYAVEEVYEVLDAIDDGDVDKYIEELGDLLLQVAFHAQLARENGEFVVEDVIQSISEKLLRRHPHVFGDLSVDTSEEVLANWEIIKRAEKGNQDRKSRLDGVPRSLPALAQALEVSKRAAKAGFEWESIDGVFSKVEEEIAELKEAIKASKQNEVRSELGDLLFTVVNLARFMKVDPEDSLRQMVKRFGVRFRSMEAGSIKPLEEIEPAKLEELWQAAKREELKYS